MQLEAPAGHQLSGAGRLPGDRAGRAGPAGAQRGRPPAAAVPQVGGAGRGGRRAQGQQQPEPGAAGVERHGPAQVRGAVLRAGGGAGGRALLGSALHHTVVQRCLCQARDETAARRRSAAAWHSSARRRCALAVPFHSLAHPLSAGRRCRTSTALTLRGGSGTRCTSPLGETCGSG